MRLYNNGAELQSTSHELIGTAISPTVDTTIKRSGLASWKFTATGGNKYIQTQAFKSFDDTMFSRIYIYCTGFPSATTGVLWHVSASGGTTIASISVDTSGHLQLRDGVTASTQVGSNSAVIYLNSWNMVELMTDSGGTTEMAARLNGVQFASGAMTDTNDASKVGFGILDSPTWTVNVDDVAVNDNSNFLGTGGSPNQNSWVGDSKLIVLRPNAAGDANGFATAVGGTAGAANNYTRVNEITPDDATSYNGTATTTTEDMFNVDDSGIEASDVVNVIQLKIRRRESAAGTGPQFRMQIRKTAGGTTGVPYPTANANTTTSTSWATLGEAAVDSYHSFFYQDPDGAAWTKTTLDSMQIGYKTATGTTNLLHVSNVWAYVDYTPHYLLKDTSGTIGTFSSSSITGGTGSTAEAYGQSITTTSDYTLARVDVQQLSKTGSPTDNLFLTVTSALNGSVLATSDTIAGSGLTGTASTYTFTFSGANKIALTNATLYYIRVERSGAHDTSNFYSIGTDTNVYAGGTGLGRAFNSWSTNAGSDAGMTLYSVTPPPSYTKNHTTDALKRKASTLTHTTDADKKISGLTRSHTTDSYKRPNNFNVYGYNTLNNGDGTDLSSYTTASVAPNQNTLQLLWVYSIAASLPNTPTVSGAGMTWTQVGTVEDGNNARRLTLFRALSNTPSSGALTIDFGGQTQTGAAWSLNEFNNVDTSGTNGANAIVQAVTNFSTPTVTSLSVTLAAFSNPKNGTAGGFGYPLNLGNGVAGSGFTLLSERHQGTPNLAMVTEYRTDPDTTVDATWTPSSVPATGIAVEIKARIQEQTKTHSTDTLKRKQATVTHTTDANKKKTNTLQHTTDTNKKKSGLTVTHTTDANKKKSGLTRTHTTDSLLRKQFTKVHTTDANKKKSGLTVSHTTDANKKKSLIATHTTDANKKKSGLTVSHTTDALKRKQFTVSHTTSSNKKKSALTVSHTTDTYKKKSGLTVSHTTDSFKRIRATVSHTTDANTYRNAQTLSIDYFALSFGTATYTQTHTTDALKRKANTLTHTTDALKRKTALVSHSTDADKRKVTIVSHTTDANKRRAYTATHTTDALKRKQFTLTHSTDSLKRKQFTKSHTTDSLLRRQVTVSHTTDANKRKATLKTHTTDALKRTTNVRTHTTDTLKRQQFTKTHTTDALKRKQFVVSHTTDANKRKGLTVSHTTNSLKRRQFTATHTTDAAILKAKRINFITNPSFENGLTNWQNGSGVSLTTDTVGVTDRTTSVKFVSDGFYDNFLQQSVIPVIPGQTYYAQARVTNTSVHTPNASGSNQTNAILYAYWQGVTGEAVWTGASVNLNTTHDRYLLSGYLVAPAGAVAVAFNVYQYGVGTAWYDSFLVERSTTLNNYFDGQRVGAAWRGTQDNSASYTDVYELTQTHTTDALKRKSFSATHTTDANKKKTTLVTHTTDSNKRKVFTTSHTTDALKRKQFTLTHTTDALKRKTNTLTHTTDSNKRRAYSVSHTTDSNKKKTGILVTHTTDALKRKAITLSHTTDALKRKTNVLSHTTSSFLRWKRKYSRDALGSLPTNANTLTTLYTDAEVGTVATDDNAYVDETGAAYILHQFEYEHTNSLDKIALHWQGKTTKAPSTKTVYLQIYNNNTSTWDTQDSNSSASANTDFDLYIDIQSGQSVYYNGTTVKVRVYQGVA